MNADLKVLLETRLDELAEILDSVSHNVIANSQDPGCSLKTLAGIVEGDLAHAAERLSHLKAIVTTEDDRRGTVAPPGVAKVAISNEDLTRLAEFLMSDTTFGSRLASELLKDPRFTPEIARALVEFLTSSVTSSVTEQSKGLADVLSGLKSFASEVFSDPSKRPPGK